MRARWQRLKEDGHRFDSRRVVPVPNDRRQARVQMRYELSALCMSAWPSAESENTHVLLLVDCVVEDVGELFAGAARSFDGRVDVPQEGHGEATSHAREKECSNSIPGYGVVVVRDSVDRSIFCVTFLVRFAETRCFKPCGTTSYETGAKAARTRRKASNRFAASLKPSSRWKTKKRRENCRL